MVGCDKSEIKYRGCEHSIGGIKVRREVAARQDYSWVYSASLVPRVAWATHSAGIPGRRTLTFSFGTAYAFDRQEWEMLRD